MEQTQVIILSGGFGTRLTPLTQDTPKPLLTVLGKSVLQRVTEKALDAGLTNITVTAMYKPELIKEHMDNHFPQKASLVTETFPLGTAGAVKNAYDGKSRRILVLSGDGIFDFNVCDILESHKNSACPVTIAATVNQEPTQYGVVKTTKNNRVERLLEKPSWGQVCSSLVNTGLYVLDSSVLSYIPTLTPFDFAKDLFPLLLSKNTPINTAIVSGYWCDIGSLNQYYNCILNACEGKIKGIFFDGMSKDSLYQKGIGFTPPVYISQRASFGKNVTVGQSSCVGDNCTISDSCTIMQSVINSGCKIGKGSGVYGSLIDKNAVIGENCLIPEGCVLSEGVKLPHGTILKKNTRLGKNQSPKQEETMKNLFETDLGVSFYDNTMCFDGKTTACDYTKTGAYLSCALQNQSGSALKLGFMCDFSAAASLCTSCMLNGAVSSGQKCFDLGKGFTSLAKFSAAMSFCDFVVYTYHCPAGCTVKIYGNDGYETTLDLEALIKKQYAGGDSIPSHGFIHEAKSITGLEEQYYDSILSYAKSRLSDTQLCGFEYLCDSHSTTFNVNPEKYFIKIMHELGAKCTNSTRNTPTFHISPDGTGVSVDYGAVKLDHTHINAILLKFAPLSALYIPDSAPEIYRIIAKSRNIPLYSTQDNTKGAMALNKEQLFCQSWLNDGIFCAVSFCMLLHQSKKSVYDLIHTVPEFEIFTKDFKATKNRASVMEKLYHLDSGKSTSLYDGVRLVLANGTVTVIPKRSSGFKLVSEAANMESAKELCEKISDVIQKEIDSQQNG